eukprot:gene12676-13977_t
MDDSLKNAPSHLSLFLPLQCAVSSVVNAHMTRGCFVLDKDLNMRALKCRKPKRQICLQCDKRFWSNFCLTLHACVHKSNKNAWFPCHTCDRKFSGVTKLLRHRLIHPLPKTKAKPGNKVKGGNLSLPDDKSRNKNKKAMKLRSCKQISYGEDNNEDIFSNLDVSNLQHEDQDDSEDDEKYGMESARKKSDLQVDIISSSFSHNKNHTSTAQTDNVNELSEQNRSPYFCDDCGMSFTREVAWHKHFQLHHFGEISPVEAPMLEKPEQSFKCQVCMKLLASRTGLKAHEETHSLERPHECKLCGYASAVKRNLTRHSVSCTKRKKALVKLLEQSPGISDEDLDSCMVISEDHGRSYCHKESTDTPLPAKTYKYHKEKFGYRSSLRGELKKYGAPYKCKVCMETFKDKFVCKLHIAKHLLDGKVAKQSSMEDASSTPATASASGSKKRKKTSGVWDTFSTGRTYKGKRAAATSCQDEDVLEDDTDGIGRDEMEDEITSATCEKQAQNPNDILQCTLCNIRLKNRKCMYKHRKLHEKKQIRCRLCHKMFSSHSKRDEHHSKAHDFQKRYTCNYCFTTFNSASNFNRHLNTHNSLSKLSSSACNRNFTTSTNLAKQTFVVKSRAGKTDDDGDNDASSVLGPIKESVVCEKKRRESTDFSASEGDQRGFESASEGASLNEGKTSYKCSECRMVCKSLKGLAYHTRFVHKKTTESASKGDTVIHYIEKTGRYVCQLCSTTLGSTEALFQHMQSMHLRRVSGDDAPKEPSSRSLKRKMIDDNAEGVEDIKKKDDKRTLTRRQSTQAERSDPKKAKGGKQDCEVGIPPVIAKCSLCGRRFSGKDNLRNHLNNFHKIPQGVDGELMALTFNVVQPVDKSCSILESASQEDGEEKRSDNDHAIVAKKRSAKNVAVHQEAGQDKELVCPICNDEFKSVKLLEKHAAMCINFTEKNASDGSEESDAGDSRSAKPGKSPIAGSKRDVASPKGSQKKAQNFPCKVCNIDFFYCKALEQHISFSPAHPDEKQERYVKCPSCKMSIMAANFEKHPCRAFLFQCSICDAYLATRTSMNRHVACVHFDQRKFTCNACGYMCSRRYLISSHKCKAPRASVGK